MAEHEPVALKTRVRFSAGAIRKHWTILISNFYKVISTDIIMQLQKSSEARSPTLQTVLMVEKFIDDNSGEYKKTELWNNLPKRVMWQTFQVIIDYLESINKIAFDKEGYTVYIWNPELGQRYKNRRDLEWKRKEK